MIGKIMAEASRSIIGMLSAKPSDMETRTANKEFSSLLLPGENRPRPASGNAAADGVKELGGKNDVKSDVEEFLNQLIGSDAPPQAPVIAPDIAKAIGIKRPVEVREGETELSSDAPFPPAAPPENGRFIPAVQPPSEYVSIPVSGADEALPKAAAAFGLAKPASDLAKRNQDNLRALTDADADVDQKLPARAETQTAPVAANKQRPILPDTPIPNAAISNMPASKDAKKASATAGQMRDALDPELAAKDKAETSELKQVLETQTLKPKTRGAAIAASKPMKIESGLPALDRDNLPAAGHLEKTAELSAPVPVAPVVTAQHNAVKTVSFDWHAPQFAERFASELADLNGNGDLRKFEINPRNMGRLEVSFIARGATEIVRIEAESDAVREVIVQHSQAIQDLLKANGRGDLTLRVDVRDNMLAASNNPGQNTGDNTGLNFARQDSAHDGAQNNAGERNNGSSHSSNRASTTPAESDAGTQVSADNSRYA